MLSCFTRFCVSFHYQGLFFKLMYRITFLEVNSCSITPQVTSFEVVNANKELHPVK